MSLPEVPPLDSSLIKALEARFPDRMPEGDLDLDAIRIKQGEVNVVRFLRAEFERQNQRQNVMKKGR